MNNNPKTITEYFNVLKSTMEEFKVKPQNIYNMDEKEFLISVIKKSMHVLIAADKKAAFLWQPGNHKNITVIETVGILVICQALGGVARGGYAGVGKALFVGVA